jgi:hypothetical protein
VQVKGPRGGVTGGTAGFWAATVCKSRTARAKDFRIKETFAGICFQLPLISTRVECSTSEEREERFRLSAGS